MKLTDEESEKVKRLTELGFMEFVDSDKKFLLLPTQLEHIRACIDPSTKIQIMHKICIFYSEFLLEYY